MFLTGLWIIREFGLSTFGLSGRYLYFETQLAGFKRACVRTAYNDAILGNFQLFFFLQNATKTAQFETRCTENWPQARSWWNVKQRHGRSSNYSRQTRNVFKQAENCMVFSCETDMKDILMQLVKEHNYSVFACWAFGVKWVSTWEIFLSVTSTHKCKLLLDNPRAAYLGHTDGRSTLQLHKT